MKIAALVFVLAAGGFCASALAQIPQGTQMHRASMALYRTAPEGGKLLDCNVTGNNVTTLPNTQIARVADFEMKSFHNGNPKQVQLIARAPQCEVDLASNILSDAGPLEVFTPTTNLFVQGVGFLFVQSTHFLTISNQVETRVAKALIKSSMLTPAHPNAAAATQFVKIFAREGEFNLESNVVDYSGNVHLIDLQLDMTCDYLTIHLDTNGAVRNMLARQNVVLTTTNNGRATGETGYYYVTNKDEMMRLGANAHWRNGDEEANADDFTYDSDRHFLTGIGHVKARWPNSGPTPAGSAPARPPLQVGTNGFRELFADYATLQFPPTNGPVEKMTARGNVLIVNQADQNSATAEQAVYEKATDRIELSGHPVWWSSNMEVKAERLTADLGDKTYHAWTQARFKMRAGGTAANGPAGTTAKNSNQWLRITSDDMEYHTNKAVFYRQVEAQLTTDDRLQDTLRCALLTLNLVSNQVESAFACDNVHGETAPDAAGVVKTIVCQRLNAYRSVKTQLLKSIDAHTNVVIEEKGAGTNLQDNTLTAETVTAQFSPVTNRLEQAVAVQNVVIDQRKPGSTIHATSDRAVYTAGVVDEVVLTGSPLAHTESVFITNAEYMTWQPKSNIFQASGRYRIVPINKARPLAKNPPGS